MSLYGDDDKDTLSRAATEGRRRRAIGLPRLRETFATSDSMVQGRKNGSDSTTSYAAR